MSETEKSTRQSLRALIAKNIGRTQLCGYLSAGMPVISIIFPFLRLNSTETNFKNL